MRNIGIIGRGFVGSAVAFGFSPQTGCHGVSLRVHDKLPSRSTHSLEDTVHHSDILFLSVPTPANSDGSINLDVLRAALQEISAVQLSPSLVLVRSTVVPGTCRAFAEEFPTLRLVFNPEFLTERNANYDFINQSRIILGGPPEWTSEVAALYRWRFGPTQLVLETSYETAELTKYLCNCFFATKLSFLNEMRLIAEACGADWAMALEGFVRDGRVGHSHLQVPGHDGRLGFGGSCFPKDMQAMISYAKGLGLVPTTLEGAWHTNLRVRPEQDWRDLKGRAVL